MIIPGKQPADHQERRDRVRHVVQGEFAIGTHEDMCISTILGSCVAACMRDPVAGVGGLNHFLLPGDSDSPSESMKYGVNAMELLINELQKLGANRRRLEAKLFGGAQVVQNLSDIGRKNAFFAKQFLNAEGIALVGESLGGTQARRIRFWPVSGRASQMLLTSTHSDIFAAERQRAMPAPQPASVSAAAGDVDLF